MNRTRVITLAAALVAAGLVAVGPSEAGAENLVGPGACTTVCNRTCPFAWKIVTDGSPKNSKEAVNFECNAGACIGCSGSAAARNLLPEVLAALSAESVDSLGAIIEGNVSILLNVERHAIQIVGCDSDALVASFPLEAPKFAAISREMDERRVDMAARLTSSASMTFAVAEGSR